MPRPEISLRATALGDKLLARLNPQTPQTIDDLLPWWERQGVLRVELVRMLRLFIEEEQVEKLPDGYILMTEARREALRLASTPPPAVQTPAVPKPPSTPPPVLSAPSTIVSERQAPATSVLEKSTPPLPPPEEPAPPPAPQEALPAEAQQMQSTPAIPPSPTGGTLRSQLLGELERQPRTCAELLKIFVEANPNTVRGMLARLKSSGLLVQDEQGAYHTAQR